MLKKIASNIGYTQLVYDRFNKKLKTNYTSSQIEELVQIILLAADTEITHLGKNYYVWQPARKIQLTINVNNYRLITADSAKKIPTQKKAAEKSQWYQRGAKAVHLVYLNREAKELPKLLSGEKTMIIRGAAGRKSPLGGRARAGEDIYFVETNSNLVVNYRAVIKAVIESEQMTPEESASFVEKYANQLQLSTKQEQRWTGKKYLAVYEIANLEKIDSFYYKRKKNMDDWIITEDIATISE